MKHRAVTKGLNPKVEMKLSEVEWIGEIPKYCKVRCLKYIADLIDGEMWKKE